MCLIWTFITVIYHSPKTEVVKDCAEDYKAEKALILCQVVSGSLLGRLAETEMNS